MLLPALSLVTADESDGGFVGPSIGEFVPEGLLFIGTPFELNRVMLIRLLVVFALVIWLWVGTRRLQVVPSRGQAALEYMLGFVRNTIVFDTLGEKDGKRFLPVLMTFFFLIIGMNLTGIIPGLQIASTAVIGLPLILAIIAYGMFVYAGFRKHSVGYLKNALVIPGVPWPLHILLIPLEFLSTFILRPITLALRLLMNMVAGHMLLVLCFTATHFFFFTVLASGQLIGLLGIGTFAFGVAFTVLELFVAVLQAYVFTILTAIYIQMALADGH